MWVEAVFSKIHRVRLTETNLDYVGSIAIDESLMRAAHLSPQQKVQVVNLNNGERLETYAILAAAGSGTIALNGAAARKGLPGDILLIIAYAFMTPEELKGFEAHVIFPDAENRLKH